jgi:hypothetical protein
LGIIAREEEPDPQRTNLYDLFRRIDSGCTLLHKRQPMSSTSAQRSSVTTCLNKSPSQKNLHPGDKLLILGTVMLSSGKANITTSGLPLGGNSITATYSGTVTIVGSAASLTQIVK